jgi:hypothetical protein
MRLVLGMGGFLSLFPNGNVETDQDQVVDP